MIKRSHFSNSVPNPSHIDLIQSKINIIKNQNPIDVVSIPLVTLVKMLGLKDMIDTTNKACWTTSTMLFMFNMNTFLDLRIKDAAKSQFHLKDAYRNFQAIKK